MHMLICTIGSKRRRSTLRFAQEVAKALSARVMLLGVVDKKRKAEDLDQFLAQAADALREEGVETRVRVETGNAEDIVDREAD